MPDEFEKTINECALLTQQSARLASKVAPVIMVSGLLQEAMNLNQELSNRLAQLAEALRNERKAKGVDAHGGSIPGETRKTT